MKGKKSESDKHCRLRPDPRLPPCTRESKYVTIASPGFAPMPMPGTPARNAEHTAGFCTIFALFSWLIVVVLCEWYHNERCSRCFALRRPTAPFCCKEHRTNEHFVPMEIAPGETLPPSYRYCHGCKKFKWVTEFPVKDGKVQSRCFTSNCEAKREAKRKANQADAKDREGSGARAKKKKTPRNTAGATGEELAAMYPPRSGADDPGSAAVRGMLPPSPGGVNALASVFGQMNFVSSTSEESSSSATGYGRLVLPNTIVTPDTCTLHPVVSDPVGVATELPPGIETPTVVLSAPAVRVYGGLYFMYLRHHHTTGRFPIVTFFSGEPEWACVSMSPKVLPEFGCLEITVPTPTVTDKASLDVGICLQTEIGDRLPGAGKISFHLGDPISASTAALRAAAAAESAQHSFTRLPSPMPSGTSDGGTSASSTGRRGMPSMPGAAPTSAGHPSGAYYARAQALLAAGMSGASSGSELEDILSRGGGFPGAAGFGGTGPVTSSGMPDLPPTVLQMLLSEGGPGLGPRGGTGPVPRRAEDAALEFEASVRAAEDAASYGRVAGAPPLPPPVDTRREDDMSPSEFLNPSPGDAEGGDGDMAGDGSAVAAASASGAPASYGGPVDAYGAMGAPPGTETSAGYGFGEEMNRALGHGGSMDSNRVPLQSRTSFDDMFTELDSLLEQTGEDGDVPL